MEFIANRMDGLRDEIQGEMRSEFKTVKARLDGMDNRIAAFQTAVQGEFERLHLRLDNIDKALTAKISQIDAELSRLRSVVYLLAKDRPELLRLLGISEQ